MAEKPDTTIPSARRKLSARERRLLRLERIAANLRALRQSLVGDRERV
jgi:hypothetical protein